MKHLRVQEKSVYLQRALCSSVSAGFGSLFSQIPVVSFMPSVWLLRPEEVCRKPILLQIWVGTRSTPYSLRFD